jgi:hypothetical protein
MSTTFILLALLMLSSCQTTYQPPGNDLWLTVH